MSTSIGFIIRFCQIGLRFGQLRLRVKFCNMEGRFINDKENVPGVDELIIFDIELVMLPETCGVTLTCSARILPSRVHGDCI